jgi:hypothetical protein
MKAPPDQLSKTCDCGSIDDQSSTWVPDDAVAGPKPFTTVSAIDDAGVGVGVGVGEGAGAGVGAGAAAIGGAEAVEPPQPCRTIAMAMKGKMEHKFMSFIDDKPFD